VIDACRLLEGRTEKQDEIHGSIVACFLKAVKHLRSAHELLS